jgi:hypothetical protein
MTLALINNLLETMKSRLRETNQTTGFPTSVTGVIRVSQFRFLLVAHRLDVSLSLHSFGSRTESLSVHKLQWFMHSRVSGASAIEVKPQP